MHRTSISLVLFLWLLCSCSLKQITNSTAENNIYGRWDIISISSSAKPDSILMKDFNLMLRTLLINAFIDFTLDHQYDAEIAGKHYTGKWILDSKMLKLTMTEKNKEMVYRFYQPEKTELELTGSYENKEYTIKLQKPKKYVLPK